MPDFIREALPTMVGECPKPTLTNRLSVGHNESVLFSVEKRAPAADSYVFFSATDLAFVDFRIGFDTEDGQHDEVEVHRSTRLPNSGRYFVSAPDSKSALKRVTLRGMQAITTEIDARLCVVSPPAPR